MVEIFTEEDYEIQLRLYISEYANILPDKKNDFIVNHSVRVKEMLDYLINITKDKTDIESFYKRAFLNGYDACKIEVVKKLLIPDVK